MAWETVIGLEVHVQLRTRTKMFCGNRTTFGDPPNTNVCPVCLGLPGALPVPNAEAIRLAARAAMALGCTVHQTSVFARKNYFYPDLPKGYQISQFDRPLATGGSVTFESPDRGTIRVGITRLHVEEDAGKLLHDRFPGKTAVDLNRAGVPLAEIVSDPDLRSPAEARAYLTTLRQILVYAGVSDCSMEQGSLRVDANISIRPAGVAKLGTKTEVKNMNSFANVERALEAERARQVALVESGRRVEQVTLLFNAATGQVKPTRSKEESHDYRYFPDPDLPPLVLTPS
ncbi:MAG TPA: Asp-tRNA(Asn)/Glu-tRNA(Gln) amidotransferase subunit GatB, partial [Gemmatimonadales bacterium]|nr:Asp-tRNA(Asn)/Glu-tRNA(Gln) amidotransferase subunit GatB [Gemmatimonadales bacterium]